MKIYHYTTIESLALILKNKTLLFNRLDCVDDIEEGSVMSSGINIGQYVFVSCWTESAEESIPLWKMYAGNKMGVRIGLERNMFKQYLVQNPRLGGQQAFGSMHMYIPPEELENPDYFIFPIHNIEEDFFCRKVQYVEDVNEKTRNTVIITPTGQDKVNATISFGEIGRYKHKRWSFQNETRFVITISPFNPFFSKPEEVATVALNSYMQNKVICFDKYFMHLDLTVLANIEITLSPNATEGQRVIVESLTRQYAPNATIKPSSLGHLVKI